MLALRANRTVGADVLIDGLWGDRPTATAAKNVQNYVSQLRKAFASDDSGAQIVTHGRGYELQLPQDAVDAVRFERLVERARREAEQGIADGAAKGALELWQGAPLADVAEEPFAGPEIRRLEELHLRAIELTIDAELAAGRHAEVIGTLEALLAEHPLHERFHAQRMLALYRAGRQSEALEAYRHARETLTEEIGIEPGRRAAPPPGADPRPGPRPRRAGAARGAAAPARGRLAASRRARARAAPAAQALGARPRRAGPAVALVSGPAGIGKTRLAAELARELHRAGATVLYAAAARPRRRSTRSAARARASARRCSCSTTPTTHRPRRSRPRPRSPRNSASRPCSSSRSAKTSRDAGARGARRAPPSASPWVRSRPRRPPRSPSSTRPPTAPRSRSRG